MDARIFNGIGECLTYLRNVVGLLRCAVFVRGFTYPGYTETANWNAPNEVLLFGAPGDWAVTTGQVIWNHGVFNSLNGSRWTLYNMRLEGTSSASKLSLIPGELYAENCYFQCFNLFPTCAVATGQAHYANSTFDDFRRLGTLVNIRDCDVFCRGQTVDLTTAGTAFDQVSGNFRIFNNSTSVFNCPPTVNLEVECVHFTAVGGSGGGWGGALTFNAQAGVSGHGFRLVTVGQDANFVNATIPSGFIQHYEIIGRYNAITVSNTANFGYGSIDAACASADITGPCTIDLALVGNNITLRGKGIVGSFDWRRDLPAIDNGATLRYVDCDQSNIVAAMTLTGTATGSTRPYDFDASSNNNILLLTGITFPTAGTDSGTNNRVLPDAAPPVGGAAPADADYLVGTANGTLTNEIVVGTTPGGELGNTWAAPTVDAIHSGSAHSDFVPVAGHIQGHVIEDEATPLTQRANMNFVGAGVTATDAGGKTVVTIPATATVNGHVIEDEGTPVTQQATMNFTGTGVTVTDAGGKTVVDIPTSSSRTFAFFTL